jgi:hypothetical protein
MKKLLIAIAAVLVSAATFAQGTVSFNTRIPGQVDAPVTLGSATGPGAGPTYSAELGVVGANGSFTPIPGSVTTFRTPTATAPALANYVVTVGEVAVPGVPTGGSANLAFRAWLTSAGSYDAAPAANRGQSAAVTVTGLGGGPTPPANLVGLTGFVIPIPEPSTIALGALGAAALLLRRRK